MTGSNLKSQMPNPPLRNLQTAKSGRQAGWETWRPGKNFWASCTIGVDAFKDFLNILVSSEADRFSVKWENLPPGCVFASGLVILLTPPDLH